VVAGSPTTVGLPANASPETLAGPRRHSTNMGRHQEHIDGVGWADEAEGLGLE
jgi:hypothetical protein